MVWLILIQNIITADPCTHGSVATGHQEYHPVYKSPGNLINTAYQGHGLGIMPVAFLPIPKGLWFLLYLMTVYWCYHLAWQKHCNKPKFLKFSWQLYHVCLAKVFQPLSAGMTTPELIQCPNGHWFQAIYGLRPYILDYPKQVFLAGIIQNWCPK